MGISWHCLSAHNEGGDMEEFKRFIQDGGANTPSFFSGNSGFINYDDIQQLKNFAVKNHTMTRLNLFSNSNDELQYMLICRPHKENIKIQKFINQDSIYMFIEGKFMIEIFDDNLNKISTIELDRTKSLATKIPKNTFYKMTMIDEMLVFLECRNGPYKRENKIEI